MYQIYTDASFYWASKKAGLGLVIIKDNFLMYTASFEINDCSDSNVAEAKALLRGIIFFYEKFPNAHNYEITIKSDCKSIIDQINTTVKRQDHNYELKQLKKYWLKGMTFQWVRGHCGHIWNEMADALSKELLI